MVGNVTELTPCESFGYQHPVRAGDGLREGLPGVPTPGGYCVLRGGDRGSHVTEARSAFRQGRTPETSGVEIGVRAARALRPGRGVTQLRLRCA